MWRLPTLLGQRRVLARALHASSATAPAGSQGGRAQADTPANHPRMPSRASHLLGAPTRIPSCLAGSGSHARHFASESAAAESSSNPTEAAAAAAATPRPSVDVPAKRTRRRRAKIGPPEPRSSKQPKTLSSVPLVTADIDELLSMKVTEQAQVLKPVATLVHPPPLARPHADYARLPTWTDRYGDPFSILVGTDGSVYVESARSPTWIIGAERQDGSRVLLFKRPLMKGVAAAQSTTPPVAAAPSSSKETLPSVVAYPVPADLHSQWLVSHLHYSMPTAEAVLLAHGHPRPSKWHVVARRDGRRDNNALENLYWQPPKVRAALDLQRLRDEALAAGVKDLEIRKNAMGNAFIATTGEFYSLLSLGFHEGRYLPLGYGVRMRAKAVYECFATLVPQTQEEKEGLSHVRAKFPVEHEAGEQEGAEGAAAASQSTAPSEDLAAAEPPAGAGKLVDVYRIKDGYDIEHLDGDYNNCARANLRLIGPGLIFMQSELMKARLQAHVERMQQEIRRVRGEIPTIRETLPPSEPHAELPRPFRSVEEIPKEKVERLAQALYHPTHPIGLGKHYYSARLRLANELKLVEVDIRRWLVHVKDNPTALPSPPPASALSAISSASTTASSSTDSSSAPPPASSAAVDSLSALDVSSPIVVERLHGHQLGRPLGLPPTQALLERLSDPSLPWTYLGRKYALPSDLLKYHAKALTKEARRRGGGAEMAKVILKERTEQMRQEALAAAAAGNKDAAAAAEAILHPPEIVVPPELQQALDRHRERKRAMEALLFAMYDHPASKISALQDEHDPQGVLNPQYVKLHCRRVALLQDHGKPAVERFIKDVIARMVIIYDEAKWLKPRKIKKQKTTESAKAEASKPTKGIRKGKSASADAAMTTTATKRGRKPKTALTPAAAPAS